MSTSRAESRPTLVLIDGHALAYRAFHALRQPMSTPEGEPTNATYGFTSMLLQVLDTHAPDYLAVTLDRGRSGRDERYPPYKANRVEQPPELAVQLDRIREVVAAFEIPIYELEGWEADDVLGTLALQAGAQGVDTLIVTGDSDTLQLVSEHTRVAISGQRFSDSKVYDEAAVRERYGMDPIDLIQWKGLKGDSSDNIPGVPGIGEKTATALIHAHGSVEAAIQAARSDDFKAGRVRDNLREYADQARLSVELVTIRTDLPIELDLEATALRGYDRGRVMELFRKLAFRSLIDRLPASDGGDVEPEEPAAPDGDYRTVDDPEALAKLIARLSEAERIAFDTETTGVDPMRAELVGISLSDRPGRGWYIPVGHRLPPAPAPPAEGAQFAMDLGGGDDASDAESGSDSARSDGGSATDQNGPDRPAPPRNLPLEAVMDALRPILGGPKLKLAHHAKYDIVVLRRHGLDTAPPVFDTMIAAWLVEPGRRALGLKDLAWSELGIEMTPITELIGKGREQISMAFVPVAEATPYASADVDLTLRLADRIEPQMDERGARALFERLEMPVSWILAEMEQRGIKVDVAVLGDIGKDLEKRAADLQDEVFEAAGREFNIGSPKQLGEVLFDELGIPPTRKTKTGYSTSAGALSDLAAQHPIIEDVLRWRHVVKLKGTYVDALPELVNPETGRIHTSWHQTVAVTGRLSSSDPNMQNIPVRSELGGQIRRAFVPEPGHVFLAADYSQMELRILAAMSGDEALTRVFEAGGDIHAATGAFLFDKAPEDVSSEERRIAKMVNFGTVYGISAFGLARSTGLSRGEAAEFIDRYYETYPGVRAYFDRLLADAAEKGYVETILGRRRYFPQLAGGSGADRNTRQRAEREAINAPIQGSAADVTKQAMIDLERAIEDRGLGSRLLLQVHDELLLEVPEDELERVARLTRDIMVGAAELSVDMVVDLKVGRSWADMEALRLEG